MPGPSNKYSDNRPCKNLYMTGFPTDVTKDEVSYHIESTFPDIGWFEVVMMTKPGHREGWCFVNTETTAYAQIIYDGLDGSWFEGLKLEVNWGRDVRSSASSSSSIHDTSAAATASSSRTPAVSSHTRAPRPSNGQSGDVWSTRHLNGPSNGKGPELKAIESNICQLVEESQTGEAEEVTLDTVQRIYGTRFGKSLKLTAPFANVREMIESMPMLQLQDFDFGAGVVTYILSLRNSDNVAQNGAVGAAEAAWPTPQASSSSTAPRGASGGGASGGTQQPQQKSLDLAHATTSLHLSGFPDTTTKENVYALLSKHCHTNTRTGGGDLAESVYIMTSNKTNTPYCFANFKR
mmetsp:Transcript_57923/g.159968  ORF Transcript_57923/g.159968 Transcript_57923/m.159968 type:complete len:349 (-) Transcript_57923:686-1732(-)